MSPLPPLRESLRALVRSRRIERALLAARALPRPPFMRTSISFLTTTTATAPLARPAGAPCTLELLGLDRARHDVWFAEHGSRAVPVLYVMHLSGEHAGPLIVAHGPAPSGLAPLDEAMPDAWLLTTRIVQRRALRVLGGGPPIRKFTLALTVEPLASAAPPLYGRACVTAYLRARAALDRVWLVPGGDLAIARVTYVGVPSELGHDKQTVVLTSA